VRPGFGFRHWFQDAAGGEGYGQGRDPQWDYATRYAVPESSGRVANTIADGVWPLLTDQDGATLGPFRYAQPTLASFLAWLATQHPSEMAEAFGAEGQRLLSDRAWILKNNPDQDRGQGLTRFEWFRRGVYLASRSPWYQRAYLTYYTANVLADAVRQYRALGWRSERGFALLARIRNSGGGLLMAAVAAARAAGGDEARQVDAAAQSYATRKDLYARRVKDLYSKHTMRSLSAVPDFGADLQIDGAPAQKQDGSPAQYVETFTSHFFFVAICVLIAAFLWR